MKKVLLFLVLVFSLAIVACGSKENVSSQTNGSANEIGDTHPTDSEEESRADNSSEDSGKEEEEEEEVILPHYMIKDKSGNILLEGDGNEVNYSNFASIVKENDYIYVGIEKTDTLTVIKDIDSGIFWGTSKTIEIEPEKRLRFYSNRKSYQNSIFLNDENFIGHLIIDNVSINSFYGNITKLILDNESYFYWKNDERNTRLYNIEIEEIIVNNGNFSYGSTGDSGTLGNINIKNLLVNGGSFYFTHSVYNSMHGERPVSKVTNPIFAGGRSILHLLTIEGEMVIKSGAEVSTGGTIDRIILEKGAKIKLECATVNILDKGGTIDKNDQYCSSNINKLTE